MRIKLKTEIIDNLLKKKNHITVASNILGISLGNPGTTNTIIKVCNLYFGPFDKAHAKIEKLLKKMPT